jgi:hypothetical protein
MGCRETKLHFWKNRWKSRHFATFDAQIGPKKFLAVSHLQAFVSFSLEGFMAVRFHRLRQGNAMRSQTDGSAEANSLHQR